MSKNTDETDISRTLDEFLGMVDKNLGNHVGTDQGVSHLEKAIIETPSIGKPPVPMLEELTEEPLHIAPSETKDYDVDVPSFMREPSKSKRLPDLDKVRKKSKGTEVIAKNSRTEKISSSRRSKKRRVVLAVICALGAVLVVVTANIVDGPVKHAKAVKSYVDNSESLSNFIAEPGDEDITPTSLEDVGKEVGQAIIKELHAHSLMEPYGNYDINKALIKYLAVTYNELVRMKEFTKKGAMTDPGNEFRDVWLYRDKNWMNIIYDYVAKQLREEGVVDLPPTLEGYLKVNGFDVGELKYSSVTGKLEYKETIGGGSPDEEEPDYQRALDNMRAYGMHLIGEEKNPEDAISEEFRKVLAQFYIFFKGYDISVELDGVHVKDTDGNEIYTLKGSGEPRDPLAFTPVDISQIRAK